MEVRATNMIWCEQCAAENWDELSALIWAGKITTQAGTLKAPAWCRSCETILRVGVRAEAITIHHGRATCLDWVEEYFDEGTVQRGGER